MDTEPKDASVPRLRRQRDALENALWTTRRALIQTVHAISAVAGRRDHYTALHQELVATLSLALGRHMGLATDRLEGLYLGALVHDVGKVAIPSEMLNKPGALTPEEFALMKTHVQAGYEMLQHVELPWPVHAIIRQHHERLDGSGYPDGLTAAAILLEARVVAVADVFQALCDYRPYREALGVRAALEKLEAGAGDAFDSDVVDALKVIAGAERNPTALWSRLIDEEHSSTVVLRTPTTLTLGSSRSVDPQNAGKYRYNR